MLFEYDPVKSMANFLKHGVNFEDAQEIWRNNYVEFAARSEFENRYAIIGYIKRKLYTCVFCLREENIRIISCRRARKGEQILYEKTISS
jgi:uncharacterized DUF497 family protein